jgi:hypothetical protein
MNPARCLPARDTMSYPITAPSMAATQCLLHVSDSGSATRRVGRLKFSKNGFG